MQSVVARLLGEFPRMSAPAVDMSTVSLPDIDELVTSHVETRENPTPVTSNSDDDSK